MGMSLVAWFAFEVDRGGQMIMVQQRRKAGYCRRKLDEEINREQRRRGLLKGNAGNLRRVGSL